MNKEEWVKRCAARYMERAYLDEDTAKDAAETCWEQIQDDPAAYEGETPESMADGDMDCWDND